jgi:hypothetical protein
VSEASFLAPWNLPMLDVPVAGEFMPADLHRSGNQVRLAGRLSGRFAFGLPCDRDAVIAWMTS